MSRPVPPSVRLAAAALALVAAVQIGLVLLFRAAGQVGWLQAAFAAVLLALLIAGLLRGQRLAWLWGRYLGLFLGGAMVLALGFQLANGVRTPLVPVLVQMLGIVAPLVAASLALGRRSAFEWFGLVCPSCSASVGRGDFLLRKARCGKCGTEF